MSFVKFLACKAEKSAEGCGADCDTRKLPEALERIRHLKLGSRSKPLGPVKVKYEASGPVNSAGKRSISSGDLGRKATRVAAVIHDYLTSSRLSLSLSLLSNPPYSAFSPP